MDDVHDLIRTILRGRNYIGPVAEVLRPQGHRKRVMDLCCGTGKWWVNSSSSMFSAVSILRRHRVQEMAAEFNAAKIYGLDIGKNAYQDLLDSNTFPQLQ